MFLSLRRRTTSTTSTIVLLIKNSTTRRNKFERNNYIINNNKTSSSSQQLFLSNSRSFSTSSSSSAVAAKATATTTTKTQSSSSSSSSSSSQQSIFNRNHNNSYLSKISLGIGCLTIGYLLGNYTGNNDDATPRVLPNGLPRTCCDENHNENHNENHENHNENCNNNYYKTKLTNEQKELPNKLKKIVGKNNIILDAYSKDTSQILMYTKGSRLGYGKALCIITPTSLLDVIKCIQLIVNCNCTILPQGSNTGLTGGSVPRNNDSDNSENKDNFRPIVIINMKKHLNTIFPLDNGNRVVCLGGAGLADLHNKVTEWFPNRESHSILGSTFLNPTTAAGIAFGSGGTQCIRKGSAYTDRALYVRVYKNKWNENIVDIINTLHIDGIEEDNFNNYHSTQYNKNSSKIEAIKALDSYASDIKHGYKRSMGKSSSIVEKNNIYSSDITYSKRLCSNSSDKHNNSNNNDNLSRYNADIRGIDCNRSEGKVFILATIHDTYIKPSYKKNFWLSFDTIETAYKFRKDVCLHNPNDLPISIEYLNKDSFDIINNSGRVMGNLILYLGTTSPLINKLWNIKLFIEGLPFKFTTTICDYILYNINNIFPEILHKDIMNIATGSSKQQQQGGLYNHHIALEIGEYGDNNMERFLQRMYEFEKNINNESADNEDNDEKMNKNKNKKMVIHECDNNKGEDKTLDAFRFVAASSFKTWCVGNNKNGISVDYVLPKNGCSPIPTFTSSSSKLSSKDNKQKDNEKENEKSYEPIKRMRYSHFGCNVIHEDIAFDRNVNIHDAKMILKSNVENICHGKLPAEHGHGTEYNAPIETQNRWKKMDPLNVMNPGIGGLSSNYEYK